MERWQLQLEAGTLKDEPNNRLNIIFPSKIEHYQVTNETYKTELFHRMHISFKEGKKYGEGGSFFEVLSVEEYSRYLQEESSELFLFHCGDDIHIYILCFMDDVVEVATYEPPIFVYSYTEQWRNDDY
ncbi:MAG: hypothetical protein IJ566_01135 [Cardiobacteriaceae bacterium]|nr:hypothetical protein [Cardiobacteriaceae bacterium]